MGRHRAVKNHTAAKVAAVAAAAVLAAPLVIAGPATAENMEPAVTEIEAIDTHLSRCIELGWTGVPDAAPGNNLEIPWTAYDEDGDLCGVRPWDNEWITYTEFTFQSSDGTWYWKVVAETNDHKAILSPVGQGLNVAQGWVTTTFAPWRAEFIIPDHR